MVSRFIRQCRCEDLIDSFLCGDKRRSCVFFTLTTADVVDLNEIRGRWRSLRHFLVEKMGKGAKYVMNYELHPKGHGWHIHSVWNRFIDLRQNLLKIQSFGFGRVDVRRVYKRGVALYLTKHCLKSYRRLSKRDDSFARLRLVNCSRGLPCLSDYHWESELITDTRRFLELCKKYGYPQFNKLPFFLQWKICEFAVMVGCVFPSQVAKKATEILVGDFEIEVDDERHIA